MGQPESLGQLIDLDSVRDRFRGLGRSREEIDARAADIVRLQRQSRTVGERLSALVDWPAVTDPDALREDHECTEGLAWMRAYQPGQPGACLWGTRGTGKTTLTCHLLHRLMADGWTVALVSAPAMLRAVMDRRFGQDVLRETRDVDVLVLDDLGADTWQAGWGGAFWSVLDARWQCRRREGSSLIVTTNLDPTANSTFGWLVQSDQDKRDWGRGLDRLTSLAPQVIHYGGRSRRAK